MNFYKRLEKNKYERWVLAPVRAIDGNIIEKRWIFIEDFCSKLDSFLTERGYIFGRNEQIFRRKFAYFWYFSEIAYAKNLRVFYGNPLHRNHDYDSLRFFDIISFDEFLQFTNENSIEGFCDNSNFGERIRSELLYFIYHYIDIDKSPAHEEVHELLHQEEEDRKLREDMKKNPHKYLNGGSAKYDYDVSELGYFRGDRIMT
jgi:hypothetical protein